MMMSNEKLTEEKLTEIEKAAKAATPGPWTSHVDPFTLLAGPVYEDSDDVLLWQNGWESSIDLTPFDIAHIATSDPPTVLSLVAEVRRLRECLQIAGIQAFMRDKPPEEVADHLRSVMASYVKAAEEAEVRVKELEAELRGDVDSLICKCGYEDCDAVIAEYDVEDCNWTDTHRIERLRTIRLERHYDESPSEARVRKLEERLERVRDICIGWSSMKEYTRTERRILAQLRDAIAATGKETENG